MATFRYVGHRFDEAAFRTLIVGAADLEARGQRVLAESKRLVGVDTGRLLRSIRPERGSNSSGPYFDVIAGQPGRTPYLWPHHFGAEPHVIRPRRARALRFEWHGKIVFFAKVNHPGSAGTYFLQRALRKAV